MKYYYSIRHYKVSATPPEHGAFETYRESVAYAAVLRLQAAYRRRRLVHKTQFALAGVSDTVRSAHRHVHRGANFWARRRRRCRRCSAVGWGGLLARVGRIGARGRTITSSTRRTRSFTNLSDARVLAVSNTQEARVGVRDAVGAAHRPPDLEAHLRAARTGTLASGFRASGGGVRPGAFPIRHFRDGATTLALSNAEEAVVGIGHAV
ncbi:hypothetical protein ON010_g10809 [Phytophthora cinnamomi]|nr:hypothetical protein ON010_g10809 [Phytophthora cinnamomi]